MVKIYSILLRWVRILNFVIYKHISLSSSILLRCKCFCWNIIFYSRQLIRIFLQFLYTVKIKMKVEFRFKMFPICDVYSKGKNNAGVLQMLRIKCYSISCSNSFPTYLVFFRHIILLGKKSNNFANVLIFLYIVLQTIKTWHIFMKKRLKYFSTVLKG